MEPIPRKVGGHLSTEVRFIDRDEYDVGPLVTQGSSARVGFIIDRLMHHQDV